MSQYPNPYPQQMPGQPMFQGQNPYDALMAPARKAGIMLFVLGGVAVIIGLCMALFSLVDLSQIPQDQQAHFQSMIPPGESMQVLARSAAVLFVLGAIALIVTGFFVRRGKRGGLIAGVCVTIPALFVLGINVVNGFLMVGGVQAIAGAVLLLVPVVMCIATLRWLIQGLGNARQIQYAQSMYQAQYYQYQQQAMQFGQQAPPGYLPPAGYGAPPAQSAGYSNGSGGGYGGGYGAGYGAPPQPGFVPGQGPQWQQPNWPLQPPLPPQTPHNPNPPQGPTA